MSLIDEFRTQTSEYLTIMGSLDTYVGIPTKTWGDDGKISAVNYSTGSVVLADWQPYTPWKETLIRDEKGQVIKYDFEIFVEYDVVVDFGYRITRTGDSNNYTVVYVKDWNDHILIFVKNVKGEGNA